MGNPYTIEPKLRLWSGRPDALSRDYDPDQVQPWRPEDGLRLKPAAWAAEGFREITDIEDGFTVVIGDITHLEDALRRIANTDYRGNRSTESQIAFEAMKESR